MRARLFAVLGVLVGLGALAYGGWVWYYAVTFVWTDDAYVEGTISPISAKVAGHVVELRIGDNQAVKQGDLLLRVDPRDFQARVEQARAAVATAEANLRAARAEVPLTRDTTLAQTAQARAGVEAALVAVRSG
jgi:membrane fusion protein (multidrug efflux system)